MRATQWHLTHHTLRTQMIAAESNETSIITICHELKANPHIASFGVRWTCFHHAAAAGSGEAIDLITNLWPEPSLWNKLDARDRTALDLR